METLYNIFLAHPKVSTDTRKIESGSIFFALSGGNFDGNQFAAAALSKGAVCAVVDKAEYALDNRCILVEDTLVALQELAKTHREHLKIPFIAISGSNGKTTTKELLGAVLSRKYKVCMTQGNLNNHIGVPLTLLSVSSEDELAIIEMGASAKKEIELLCQIAKPDYALLTNVGRAHLEGFGGERGVREAKGELFDYVQQSGGVAFYRSEDAVISEMIAEREGLKTCAFSSCRELPQSKLSGEYNRFNVAAAVAVGEFFEVSPEQINNAIEDYTPTNNRSQITQTSSNTLILDCYNANPSSMESALENLRGQSHQSKVAVLGDMFELGEYSLSEHIKILELLEAVDIKTAIVIGGNFLKAVEKYPLSGYELISYKNCEEFIEKNKKITNSLVLLKGSRGIGLEKLIAYL